MDISNRIYKLRKDLKLGQEAFAKEIGVGKHTLIALELGRKQPSDRVITCICNRYMINSDWLKYGKGRKYFLEPNAQKALKLFNGLHADLKELALTVLYGLNKAQNSSTKKQ